ncbi:hypothetical protein EYM_04645 [Ignicoccus islandicus DSM 13165]|uniref:Uncharacterized protein n=1 Tax=Ignicoccus islandicus DSM 13165 TaxID=940295 RepID=A0A0U3G2H9_9CREN|nr:hypothetical protein [Ignicoccus islandicus]ALU12508.1 hypothetical protein EYM_04645 [Ignicoccus islandicus DSM 13165]
MVDVWSLALIALGFPLGATRFRKYSKHLSIFLVYIDAPILGFWAGVELKAQLHSVLAPSLALLVAFIPIVLFRDDCPKRGAFAITSAFGNTIFLGIPATLALGGSVDSALVYAMVTTFIHYTLAAIISCKEGKARIQPFTVTFLLGLLLSTSNISLESIEWTKRIGAELSKLGLLLLGLNFNREVVRLSKDVMLIGLLKHVALPLLTLPIFLMSKDLTLLIESSMPPAFMNIALAMVYGYDVTLTTQAVITLTVLWIFPFAILSVLFHK